MKKQLVFATSNEHKVREVNQILKTDIALVSLKAIGCLEDIPETKDTIAGNAIQKAQYVYDKYNMSCFAEDTGLEIVALGGEPGVKTARYAGPAKDAAANMALVLEKLIHQKDRSARFKTVIALLLQGELYTFEGIVNGHIAHEKKGAKGFGYDPIFIPENQNLSFAEMGDEAKNAISHRGRAFKKFNLYLDNIK